MTGYIEKNGYIGETEDLIKPPFDTPANLFQLFSGPRLAELLRLINGVKKNAGQHCACISDRYVRCNGRGEG